VTRLWEEDVEPFLTMGAALVQLAPLADIRVDQLPTVIRRMSDRINPLPHPRAEKLWTATYLLMGLRYSDELVTQLLEGVQIMQESTTYQRILRDGRVEEARRIVLRLGTRRFHEPDAATITVLEGIKDIDRLEALSDRILDPNVQGWGELLETS
jgi:predicted transposase YdaD